MSHPALLYRVTRPILRTDNEGYILSHNRKEESRILPLAHPDDWDLIARYFAFPHIDNSFSDENHVFRVFSVRYDSVENIEEIFSMQLNKGEWKGMVKQTDLVTDAIYTWEKAYAPFPVNIPEWQLEGFSYLMETLYWKPVKITDFLSLPEKIEI